MTYRINYQALPKASRWMIAESLYELSHDAHNKAMQAMMNGDEHAYYRYRYRAQSARMLATAIDPYDY